MPDLGPYAFYVLSAYGVSITLIVVLCVMSVLRARRVRTALDQVETRAQTR